MIYAMTAKSRQPLDDRTLARIRDSWGHDIPDDAIRRTSTFAWVRFGIALHDLVDAFVGALPRPIRRLLP